MKKVLIFLLMSLPVSIFAEGDIEIRGKVVNGLTHHVLFESHVYIDEQTGVLSDEDGYFNIDIPEDRVNENLNISYLGFATYSVPIEEVKDRFLVIGLRENLIVLDEMVVHGKPWDEFKEMVVELADEYETKEEFYAVMFDELEKIDPELADASQASFIANNWPVIALCMMIVFMWSFMMRPLIDCFKEKQVK